MNISEAIKAHQLPALLSFHKERSLDWNQNDQEWVVKSGTTRLYHGLDEAEAVAYLTGEKIYSAPPKPRLPRPPTFPESPSPEQVEESRRIFSSLILPKEATQ